MKRTIIAIALAATTALAAPASAGGISKADYAAALAGSQRSDANRARDQYRHPAETLSFFGLKPDMTVVEVAPGGGWYTEVIAPLVKAKGKLYAAHANPAANERAAEAVDSFRKKLAADPALSGVEVTSFGKDHYDSLAPAGGARAARAL